MKIAYCILGTYNSGGMERVLANKANYLAKLGHEVTVITTDQQGRGSYYSLDPKIRSFDLQINYTDDLNYGLAMRLVSYARKQRIHRKKLSLLLKEKPQDIVISLFDHDVTILSRLRDRSRKVLEIHFSRYKRLQYNRKGVWRWLDKFRSYQDLNLVKKFSRFVVLTEEDKGYWGALPNIHVIPNANSFVPKERSTVLNKRVIAVGRYDTQKNFEDLIHIWKLVSHFYPDWSLTIYGQGFQKQLLENLIDQLDLQNSVTLHPPVADIENAYVDSAILVMTSRYEGLPMALLEGQACGLPLVSYACKCGPRDIIHNGVNGYLIEEGDRIGMADKLTKLMGNHELRKELGNNAAEMSENYAEDLIMKHWLDLFNELLQPNQKNA
ncbi:glycosyltransferase family 4 protein [Sphingobacterium corticibacter]|uniref:Glycosyltransferase family 4 protein n=1 Tax=Sphingobacterium corticibacter TaxID=2171749 RepID=A0A2T8HK59_9SPHI|nr:glycosyltransferase family 4 protein [Sphingobacterium corticibacter]PVH25829.1 glycosyltransferase family 4 protein [Sphingobacterium corticibacter]